MNNLSTKIFINILIFLLLTATVPLVFSQDGETFFQSKCALCHTLGNGKLIGPDLQGIHERHSEKWLLEFINSSQTMIAKGDAKAKKIFEEYYQTVMPDPDLTEAEIKEVLAYIKLQNEVTKHTENTTQDEDTMHQERSAKGENTNHQVSSTQPSKLEKKMKLSSLENLEKKVTSFETEITKKNSLSESAIVSENLTLHNPDKIVVQSVSDNIPSGTSKQKTSSEYERIFLSIMVVVVLLIIATAIMTVKR